ncbi:MAG TPA: YceI family protein [Candidatus Sulfotelmatobacter sp.]|nr:YceI family protein [Candidatus Sulfotelmatobacter sp.]
MTATTQSTEKYAIDSAHSSADFVVRHMVIAKVRGRFGKLTGTIDVPAGAEVPTSATAEIDVNSIDTREEQRDGHLKSADFLEADKYPTITFVSTGTEGNGPSFTLKGMLSIHGVTREVAIAAEYEGRGKDPWGNERIGYSGHVTINRKDYGLTWNQALETGGVLVGDEVRIEITVEAIKQQASA